MTLSNNVIAEKNSPNSPNPWLVLLDITIANPELTEFRVVNNTEDVLFGETSYEDANLLAYYKLEENSAVDANVVDSVSGNDGTAAQNTDQISVVGKVDNAFTFNGSSDIVAIPYQNVGTTLSYAMWFKRTGSDSHYLFALMRTLINVTDSFLYWYPDSTESFAVAHEWSSNSDWNHLVITQTGTVAKMYLNGVLVETETSVFPVNTTNVGNGSIGGPSLLFEGQIDDVRIYNKVLSQVEIDNIYNKGAGVANVPIRYSAFSFQLEPIRESSKGEITSIGLKISNVSQLLSPYLDYAVGSLVTIKRVNTALLTENLADLEVQANVVSCNENDTEITFTLGRANPTMARFPLHKFIGRHCRWNYKRLNIGNDVRCGMVGWEIESVTKAAEAVIGITEHPFIVGSVLDFDGGDMTELDGLIGTVQSINANDFTVNIDTQGFTTYTTGGLTNHTLCPKTFKNCRERNNEINFGGFPCMRDGTARLA
ncbi:MAG: hypothetical protein KAS32_06905 [Candidatus Peribacteraceae bacterium]|nr:hypothetical protein [Candidatus Peribacteraceae bacterium]